MAQNAYGLMCERGKGLPQDYEESWFWFRLASNQMGQRLDVRDYLETRDSLTYGQKDAVEKRVAEWTKTHPKPYPPWAHVP